MSLSVSIITPEKVVSQRTADFVVLPAVTGEIGILTNHVPLLAQLTVGEVRITSGDEVEHLVVSGGFAEVRKNEISIFAETAEAAQDIDLERARQAAERARALLKLRGPDVDLVQAEASLRRALLRLNVAEFYRRKTPHK